ncbi:hypothetical protein CVT26_004504 [Gymnopilus dilepis]|uniref:UFSP1/2/DUB catalytic domain-containing protein n=1 Tax=Gymnopilus dilepis TaxID=231916 RepID=A0A409W775_9AGAR|nr:hypothetical protein CVT26_004504 [Gymnopilus dilepis]
MASSAAVSDASQSLQCLFCLAQLDLLSISQREAHYEHHLINDWIETTNEDVRNSPRETLSKPLAAPQRHSELPGTNVKKSGFPCKNERDDFWYPALNTPPPPSFTPGLIPLLQKGLLKSHARGFTRRAVLCSEIAVHVNREPWDAGWGCGYRNFLMACAVLMNQTKQPMYFPLLDSPISPSIRNLQTWIETAWKEGFDIEGQQQLKKLINTRKWIGTSDLWVAFVYRSIPAELVDFKSGDDSQNRISDLVINWVIKYFTPEQKERPSDAFSSLKVSQVFSTDKIPLILQHNGHSRTVVGYEIDKNGVAKLLVFDPAYKPTSEIRAAAIAASKLGSAQDEPPNHEPRSFTSLKRKRSGNLSEESPSKGILPQKTEGFNTFAMLKKFRLDPKALGKKKEYQILHFPMTAPLTDYERMQRKVVRSTRIS